MRLRAGVIAIIVMAVALTGGWGFSRTQPDARAPLSQGLEVLPADTRIAGFTDWARIRKTLGFGRITTSIDRDSLLASAFDRDLSARSIMENFTEVMVANYGWSVADLRWEMYGQASDGALLAAGMNDNLERGTVTAGLRKLGYVEKGGIWSLESQQLAAKAPGLPRTFANVAVLGDERLILMSDAVPYLRRALALRRDRGTSLAGVVAARQTAAPLIGAESAVVEVRKDHCASTGLSDEPANVRSRGRNIVNPLGRLEPVAYGARALFDRGEDQRLRFSLTFDSAALATRQLALRTRLTTGPFVGRPEQIGEVLKLTSSSTRGPNAVLDFGLVAGKGSFMNGNGAVLFAACKS